MTAARAIPFLLAAGALGGRAALWAGFGGVALLLTGASHALLYLSLLAWFGATLRPGRVPLVTAWARRLTPGFHRGMEGYTRGVTLAWCLFFAGQVALSPLLLWRAPEWWPALTGLPGFLLVLGMAGAERLLRGLRFPGMAHTGLPAVIRAVRADLAGLPAAGAGAAGPARGCPGHSGSGTPHPAGSAPAPEG